MSTPEAFPSTHWSFITEVRAADGDGRLQLTGDFLCRYLTPMRAHLRGRYRSMQELDREDLLQDFVTSHFVQKSILEHARRERGKLRSLLRVSLNNFAATWCDRRRDHAANAASFDSVEETATQAVADPFDLSWARFVISEAVIDLKNECADTGRQLMWDVFDLRVLRPALLGAAPTPYVELSERMGLETRRVENLLVSAKRMLHRKLHAIVRGYTETEQAAEEEIRDLWRAASSAGGAAAPFMADADAGAGQADEP